MTPLLETSAASPWVTIWFSPRRAIDGVLAAQPRHLIWLLASLGAISVFYGELISVGLTSQLFDWRFLLGSLCAGAILGIGWLYFAAFVFAWIGRLLGGRASSLELRAAFAWSAMPNILGLVVALALVAVWRFLGGLSAVAPDNFSLLLNAIMTVCGLWAFVVMLLMLSRVEQFGFWRTLTAYVTVMLVPLFGVLLIRTFLFQPFDIPSRSMVPTLLEGDHFFVSKYAYGYSHYSLPFSPPLFSGRIFGSQPARGDVVAFRSPKETSTTFVKRVVGLPGDRIQMKQGLLYVNDQPVARERLPDFVGDDPCRSDSRAGVKHWGETLSSGVSYETLDCIDNGFYDNTNVYTVPDGHFFTLGDNRDNSTDSRVLSSIGYVPFENIIGRVGMIYFSRASDPVTEAANRPERFGLMVR